MAMKNILSLFDESGEWSQPYEDAGHCVWRIDIKTDPAFDVTKFCVQYLVEELGIEDVDGILMAPPCTDFSGAGAQYWPAKDADGRTAAARELVMQGLRCVEYFNPDWWVMENPVGRIREVCGLKPAAFAFHPHEFAGYVEGLTARQLAKLEELGARGRNWAGEWTPAELALVKRSNRYTKKTMLWGHFNAPVLSNRAPIAVCKQGSWLQKLGGKGEATKQARSETPAGFARAFWEANDWSPMAVLGWGGTTHDRLLAAEGTELEGSITAQGL